MFNTAIVCHLLRRAASSREARGAAPAEAFAIESTDLLGVLGEEAGGSAPPAKPSSSRARFWSDR